MFLGASTGFEPVGSALAQRPDIKFQVVDQATCNLNSSSLPTLMLFVCLEMYHYPKDSFRDVIQYCVVNQFTQVSAQ